MIIVKEYRYMKNQQFDCYMFQIEFDTKEIESVFPHCRYINRLGSGSFATVHLVADRTTGQQIALKKVTCFGMGQYEKTGALNEVRILKSLDHKNIIKVRNSEFDSEEDILYIFMEYASKGDVCQLIEEYKEKRKHMPQSTIWKAISDVSDALFYLHRNQIIHRDLKPANIFRKQKQFKVGDMNVAKIVKAGNLAVTKTGSPLYTAPEVWESQFYGEKCDIWSLGVLIYQMCCLKVPFEADSIDQMIKKVKYQKSKSLPTVYSFGLDDLVKKMLQVDPEKRLSAEEVFKIASERMRIQTEGQCQSVIESMMETIVFPQNHQRWINIVPLPPKTSRGDNNRPPSIKRDKSGPREREKQSRSRQRSAKSKQSKKLIENMSEIMQPSVPPTVKRVGANIPRSISRKQKEIRNKQKSIFQEEETKVRLPTILRRKGSSESRRPSSRSHDSQRSRDNKKTPDLSSSRSKRKMSGEYQNTIKKLLNRS